MRRIVSATATVLFAAALYASDAIGQEIEGIVVRASRVEVTEVRTAGIVPEYLLEASYRVTYEDLDVTTKPGREEVRRRVEKAAELACKEIGREYPFAEPGQHECANKAASAAMEQFRTRLAAR